jgi:hypothetical protein
METSADFVSECHMSPEGKGLITCPWCGFGKVIDLRDRIPPNRRARVRCKCGKKFETFFEIRQHDRKHVKLMGRYTNMTARRSGLMIVEDISEGGIGFQVTGSEYFREHDLVKATFELDNRNKSRITLRSKVKHTRENFVGCKALEFPEGRILEPWFLPAHVNTDEGKPSAH